MTSTSKHTTLAVAAGFFNLTWFLAQQDLQASGAAHNVLTAENRHLLDISEIAARLRLLTNFFQEIENQMLCFKQLALYDLLPLGLLPAISDNILAVAGGKAQPAHISNHSTCMGVGRDHGSFPLGFEI